MPAGDVLERALALERAAELEAARRCAELESAVLDSLAHDMKTPLATMKVALASLLSLNGELPETHEPFLSVIDEEVDHLNVAMGKVLHRGNLENGLAGLSRKPQSVESLVNFTRGAGQHTSGTAS